MSKSLHELESENAEFLAAKANAGEEIARLGKHRQHMLLSESVDAIMALDTEIVRQQIASEIAAAKANALRGPLHYARIEAQRFLGVDMPNDAELERLYEIVVKNHPWLNLERPATRRSDIGDRPFMAEFRNALFVAALRGRLAEPSDDRYWASMVDDANATLRAHRLSGVEGDALLAACLAIGDVHWRRADPALGQLLEVGLARPNQGTPARPRWREILSGAALLPPLSPRRQHSSSSTYSIPRVSIRYLDDGTSEVRA
jgi:hypothetical protein